MKTALVTGGTSGIGLSIAKALLRAGDYEVFLIGRNPVKGSAIADALSRLHPGRVQFIQLDLSDIKAVQAFARQFAETHGSLDLLANVAGVINTRRVITHEGFETTFAVGYLSAFVLCTELAPLLEEAANGRIANVSGVASFVLKARLDFDDLTFSRRYIGFKTAITTIHAKTVLSQMLALKYAARGIDINAFHPGPVRSDLMKDMPWIIRILFKIPSLFMSSDSKTGIRACCAPELKGTTGKYLKGNKLIELNFEESYRDRLWLETERLLTSILQP
jgi:NAD(P)-dependent dehydrogenase (short-subunit alcohol dehydrogenase family)